MWGKSWAGQGEGQQLPSLGGRDRSKTFGVLWTSGSTRMYRLVGLKGRDGLARRTRQLLKLLFLTGSTSCAKCRNIGKSDGIIRC